MRPIAALSLLAALAQTSTGCSFIYTKGPQPNLDPPPPCTASNSAPTADTVVAAASVVALVAGAIVAATATSNCTGEMFCGLEQGVTGIGLIAGGAIGTAIFVPSAIVGYNRTADCRAWLKANPQYVPAVEPPSAPLREAAPSSLVPATSCPPDRDAPRVCALTTSRQSSMLALERQPR